MTPSPSLILRHPSVRAILAAAAVFGIGALLVYSSRSSTPVDAGSWHFSTTDATPGQAPDFELPDESGTVHALGEFAGRPILLNFWASWCPPCLDEMPSLQRLSEALADTDLVILAVTFDESWEDARAAMEKTGFGGDIVVLMDRDRSVAGSYGTIKVPETYLIDRNGSIVHHFKGARDWDRGPFLDDLRGLIEDGPEVGHVK